MNVSLSSRIVLQSCRRRQLVLVSQLRHYRKSENFTYDWDKVPETLEKERKKYEEYTEVFGEERYSNRDTNIREIKYTASQDPAEWSSVQNIIDACAPKLIPVPNTDGVQPSGFFVPTAKHGDYPYFVRRAPSWLYPVYVEIRDLHKNPAGTTVTVIKKVEGNIFRLKTDLDKFLFERYEREFIGQANEILQKIVFRGNLGKDFKDFLKMKGF